VAYRSNAEVQILNSLGQLIQKGHYYGKKGSIDISNLKTGTYFIKILAKEGNMAKAFLKM